jgi:hypothetical protein
MPFLPRPAHLRRSILAVALAVASAALLTGCAATLEERFPGVFETYRSAPTQKALAFARDRSGAYAYGYGTGHPTKQAAIKRALQECSARRQAYGVRRACVIYMVNDSTYAPSDSLQSAPAP